jgi:Tfp pilus assembly protein FimT
MLAAVNSRSGNSQLAFSVVELLVVLAVIGISLAVAIPNFSEFVRKKRLESVVKEYIADVSHARTISVSNQQMGYKVYFSIGASNTCYTMYIDTQTQTCDCTKPAGTACARRSSRELKVMNLPSNSGITMISDRRGNFIGEGYGALQAEKITFSDGKGLSLRANLTRQGLVSVCSVEGSFSEYPVCSGS